MIILPFRIALVVAAASGVALGQDAPPKEDADLLAGPPVEQGPASGGGLGMMNFDGSMERPDAPLAELAVRAMELDEPTRAKVDAVLMERAAEIDAFVLDHYDLVPKMKELRASGDRAALREAMQSLRGDLRPILEKGTLEQRLAAVLKAEDAERMRTMIAEHRAMAAERRGADREAGAAGPRNALRGGPGRGGAGQGERAVMFAEAAEIIALELPRSYRRIIETQKASVDDLVAGLGLDAETEERVRRVFREAAADGRNNIDRRALIADIAAELTPEQRRNLARTLSGRRAGAGPAAKDE